MPDLPPRPQRTPTKIDEMMQTQEGRDALWDAEMARRRISMNRDPDNPMDDPKAHRVGQAVKGAIDSFVSIPETMIKTSAASLHGVPGAREALADQSANVATMLIGGGSVRQFGRGVTNELGTSGSKGIRAYHGSPHDFDKFDMSKIGTGQGAQTYGHGLYLAENEATAKAYRDALTEQILVVPGKGGIRNAKIGDTVGVENAIRDFATEIGVNVELTGEVARFTHSDDLASIMLDAIDAEAMDIGAAIARLERLAETEPQHLQQTFVPRDKAIRIGEMYQAAAEGLRKMNAAGLDVQEFGRMYEARINATPAEFLDWDKPLSEQPKAVQDLFGYVPRASEAEEQAVLELARKRGVPPTELPEYKALEARMDAAAKLEREFARGADVYDGLSRQSINNDWGPTSELGKELAAKKLRAAGIKGIRYKDAGSRGKGEGTSNYVVFDDNIIDIIRKYGIAGLIGGSAAAGSLSINDAEAAVKKPKIRAKTLLEQIYYQTI